MYVAMHKTLERVNKNRIHLLRGPVLTNSHKFVTRIYDTSLFSHLYIQGKYTYICIEGCGANMP